MGVIGTMEAVRGTCRGARFGHTTWSLDQLLAELRSVWLLLPPRSRPLSLPPAPGSSDGRQRSPRLGPSSWMRPSRPHADWTRRCRQDPLALAIAHDLASHFADGLVWVDLAPLADPRLVPATVATALGIPSGPERSVRDALVAHLRREAVPGDHRQRRALTRRAGRSGGDGVGSLPGRPGAGHQPRTPACARGAGVPRRASVASTAGGVRS